MKTLASISLSVLLPFISFAQAQTGPVVENLSGSKIPAFDGSQITNLTNGLQSATGSGSGLTSLNASQLTSGTVADARLSANVPLLNAANQFTASNVFIGAFQVGTNITSTSNSPAWFLGGIAIGTNDLGGNSQINIRGSSGRDNGNVDTRYQSVSRKGDWNISVRENSSPSGQFWVYDNLNGGPQIAVEPNSGNNSLYLKGNGVAVGVGSTSPAGSSLTLGSGIQIIGNGAGLTNVAGASVQTNWISGQLYTNTSNGDWYVRALATWTTAAVTGDAEMDLQVGAQGGTLSRLSGAGASTTVAVTLSQSYTNEVGGFVGSQQVFTFTNTSSGAGNVSTLVSGTGQKKQW